MSADGIILGDGVFAVNGTDIALTRGGGNFTIEREYKQIEADGDYGPVKGRIRKIKSIAKLTLNALELLPENLPLLYPAIDHNGGNITARGDIEDADYQTVSWTGRTKGGRAVIITLENAINLEELNWALVDKEEVVPEIVYTATYLEDDKEAEPWNIRYVEAGAYKVTFTVKDDAQQPVPNASVVLWGIGKLTDDSGIAEFLSIPVGNNQPFSITAGGYQTYFGSVNVVTQDISVTVALEDI